ncbi:MAG: Gfo/Idh/MocA family oxidoreductase [Flavobacteriaceae bacterium]|nr:Gfo/Idh/MocA family oxidoreductase [Flavobacteriaceae bacterium]
MKHPLLFYVIIQLVSTSISGQNQPMRTGVIGLTHTHVHWIFNSEKRGDIKIVGIVEPNRELAQRYADQYGFSMNDVYNTIEEMVNAKKPEAVTAFGTIYDHLKVVAYCAPKGIHVMVEKPLAVSLEDAEKMKALADKYNIHLLTNYETTWYPTNHKAHEVIRNDTILGAIRKIIVRDGHRGPKKIGVNNEFLEWLTDPVLNGGGAITDFGCYGANLTTWLLNGKKPNKVTAITRQFQPENNPNVDDEALIVLEYDNLIALIEASWNWPIGRKDMEVYGLKGVVYADNRHQMRIRMAEGYDGYREESFSLDERKAPYDDPFSYFAAIVKNEIEPKPYDLSSLENNMIVMEILDAAKKSAATNKTIDLK